LATVEVKVAGTETAAVERSEFKVSTVAGFLVHNFLMTQTVEPTTNMSTMSPMIE
jgi:hypothetical protein